MSEWSLCVGYSSIAVLENCFHVDSGVSLWCLVTGLSELVFDQEGIVSLYYMVICSSCFIFVSIMWSFLAALDLSVSSWTRLSLCALISLFVVFVLLTFDGCWSMWYNSFNCI